MVSVAVVLMIMVLYTVNVTSRNSTNNYISGISYGDNGAWDELFSLQMIPAL